MWDRERGRSYDLQMKLSLSYIQIMLQDVEYDMLGSHCVYSP
jgi:hypothetical protein